MKLSTVAVLMVGLAIAAFVGYQVLGSVGSNIEKTEQWCNDHNGEFEFHDEVMYCDLGEKDVLASDLMEANYPENASTLPHTDVEKYHPIPPVGPIRYGVYAILVGLLAFGGGYVTNLISRYRA